MVDEGLELRQAMPDDAEEMFVEIEGNREYLREWLPWLDDITSPENEMTFLRGTLREYEKGDGASYRPRQPSMRDRFLALREVHGTGYRDAMLR